MHATPTQGPRKAPSGPAALDIVRQQHSPGTIRNQPNQKPATEGLVSALQGEPLVTAGTFGALLLRSVKFFICFLLGWNINFAPPTNLSAFSSISPSLTL